MDKPIRIVGMKIEPDEYNRTTLEKADPKKLKGLVEVPDGVRVIGKHAFRNCTEITKIILPESVSRIEEKAFINCSSLETIELPGNCVIRDGAFTNCKKLESMTFPQSERYFNDEVFAGCESLRFIKGEGITEFGVKFAPFGKKSEMIVPMVLPQVSINKSSRMNIKVSLAMGFILEKDMYSPRMAQGYEKYVAANRDLIVEKAREYGLDNVLSPLGENVNQPDVLDEDNVQMPLVEMSVEDAQKIFSIQKKTKGIKITGYLGSEDLIDVPHKIGGIYVTNCGWNVFPVNAVIRCSGRFFSLLSTQNKINTYLAMKETDIAFSVEQRTAAENWFNSSWGKDLKEMIELGKTEAISKFLRALGEEPSFDRLSELKSLLSDKRTTNAAILDYIGSHSNANELRRYEEEKENRPESEIEYWRKRFTMQKSGGKWFLLDVQKGNEDKNIVFPDQIEGLPVVLDRFADRNTNRAHTSDIKSITIPSGITQIRSGFFVQFTSLVEITVSEDNKGYSSKDGVLYSKDGKVLYRYPCAKDLEAYEIPRGVEAIEEGAFYSCKLLKSISIPKGVKTIGNHAFQNCSSLTSLNVPDSVSWVGFAAFNRCPNLKIDFDGSVNDWKRLIGDNL